ncbi:MAG: oxidoreductase [Mycobacterium sp.]
MGSLIQPRRRNALYRALTLGGYVAFNLPRTVTLAGGTLLVGLIATHVYVLASEPALPAYFAVYSAALIVGCLLAAGTMWLGLSPRVPQLGWFLGSLVCIVFLVAYLASRAPSLPGLVAVTGRWDFAPGSLMRPASDRRGGGRVGRSSCGDAGVRLAVRRRP